MCLRKKKGDECVDCLLGLEQKRERSACIIFRIVNLQFSSKIKNEK